MPEPAHKRQLISTDYATPLMTPTMALGLSIRLSMFEYRETGDWDIFLGLPEQARAETGGADHWVLKRRELPGFAMVNTVTSASLGYPPSVFNKNSTFKPCHMPPYMHGMYGGSCGNPAPPFSPPPYPHSLNGALRRLFSKRTRTYFWQKRHLANTLYTVYW